MTKGKEKKRRKIDNYYYSLKLHYENRAKGGGSIQVKKDMHLTGD